MSLNNIVHEGALFDGRYKLLKPLSSDGGTADVWLALDINTIDEVYDDKTDGVKLVEETGIKVAIKIYRPKNALDIGEQRFREEFKIVFNCHHENLLQPINFSIYEGIPYLVLPYCENGSSEVLKRQFDNSGSLWKFISDVSASLAYLHSYNPTIVHHDIKPANILIDDNGRFVITDFGISTHSGLNREGYDDSQSGTMAYMAPERFNEEYESIPESDIWSLGATLYELITGNVPYGESGGRKQVEDKTYIPAKLNNIDDDIKLLISDCLSSDISKRPSAEYINRAATIKRYPVRNNKIKLLTAGTFSLIIVIALIILLLTKSNHEPSFTQSITLEEQYQQAMGYLESDNLQDLQLGLSMLDTLGNKGFVPALYEQAFTYGWYSDSASLARKRILGIEVYSDGNEALLPKSQPINTKAIGLLTRIEELNDLNYPEINANALYRLACYYANDNKVLRRDKERASSLLKRSLLWAKKSNDDKLIKRIEKGLIQLN
jgi:hypothetical protein